MKIILTGANGYIGQYLVPALICAGHEIVAVVRKVNRDNHQLSDVQWVEADIINVLPKKVTEFEGADLVVDLAWDRGAGYQSLHHFEYEAVTHYHFLKQLVELGVKEVLVAGTCFEYGMRSGPLAETLISNPINPYGMAKDMLRKQLQLLSLKYDFGLTWLRIFYLFGDGQPPTTLYAQFHEAVATGENVFNMSGGEQLRDYLHILEAVEKIVNLIGLRQGSGIVNICNGTPISIRQLVEQWREKVDSRISLNFGHYAYSNHEPFAFWGDNQKYQSLMGIL